MWKSPTKQNYTTKSIKSNQIKSLWKN